MANQLPKTSMSNNVQNENYMWYNLFNKASQGYMSTIYYSIKLSMIKISSSFQVAVPKTFHISSLSGPLLKIVLFVSFIRIRSVPFSNNCPHRLEIVTTNVIFNHPLQNARWSGCCLQRQIPSKDRWTELSSCWGIMTYSETNSIWKKIK